MSYRITMPQLGESVAEGTVGRWLKAPGDPIQRDEPLVEVITDKVTAEVPCPVAGVVERVTVAEGTTVAVGQEIALIREDGAAAPPGDGQPGAVGAEPALSAVGADAAPPPAREGPAAASGPRTSPVVRRLAREHAVDLSRISGTGLGGRITRQDVLGYLAQGEPAPARQPGLPAYLRAVQPPVEPPTAASPGEAPATRNGHAADEAVPLTPMRRSIAERMVRSVQAAPHAWLMVEVDVSGLVRWRDAVKEEFRRREGCELSYVPFVLKAVVEGLREHPTLNSTWTDDGIVLKREINVGVAVALPDGIIVPVLRRADERSLAGLARALADLVSRARAGQLAVADVQGGTFTLNNTGTFGSIASQPIINHPQAAILNMEAIVKRPVVVGGPAGDAIAIRSMMNLCLSFDHRILDGFAAGGFLQGVKRRLEGLQPGASLY